MLYILGIHDWFHEIAWGCYEKSPLVETLLKSENTRENSCENVWCTFLGSYTKSIQKMRYILESCKHLGSFAKLFSEKAFLISFCADVGVAILRQFRYC